MRLGRHDRIFDRARDHFDWGLFLISSALAVIGVVNLYSATSVSKAALSEVYIQQVYWLVLGGILATAVTAIDYRHYERLGYALYGFGIVLLLLVLALGNDVRGSSRWIYIGSFSLQPSEFSKLFLIIALAKYLHDDPKSEGRTLADLLIPAAIAAVPTLLILKQPDLGTALIHGLIFATICLLTRIRWRSIATLVVGSGILFPLVWTYILKDYQKKRITDFLDPDANILGSGWHAHHARIAIGAGGATGEGFMRGTQNQFLFLPDQHSRLPVRRIRGRLGIFRLFCTCNALRASRLVGDSRRLHRKGPFWRRPFHRRGGSHLLARSVQSRNGDRPASGGRCNAAAIFRWRFKRSHHPHRHRPFDERIDAPLLCRRPQIVAPFLKASAWGACRTCVRELHRASVSSFRNTEFARCTVHVL